MLITISILKRGTDGRLTCPRSAESPRSAATSSRRRSYVKAALRMDAVPRGWPIILITDGQNTQKAGKLRKNWHAVETHATAYADLVLAVRSAYFIGNPASSFSANVVMIRRALGAAPTSTNLRVMDFPRPGSFNEQFA